MVGQELFYKLSKSFGYLNRQGYCHNGNCRTYPIVIGEFGSSLIPDIDRQWLGDFAKYIYNKDEAADGNHEHIGSWMWWAYNANSGDTGGIVTDDWQGFNWQKLNYLHTIGLSPWYNR
jgi:endoglucanase